MQELLSVGVDDVVVHNILEKIKERRHRGRQMASQHLVSEKSSDADLQPQCPIVDAKGGTRTIMAVDGQVSSNCPAPQGKSVLQLPTKSNTTTRASSKDSSVDPLRTQPNSRSETRPPALSSARRMTRMLRIAQPRHQAFIRHWMERRKDHKPRSKSPDPGAPDIEVSESSQIDVHPEDSAPTDAMFGNCESEFEDDTVSGTPPEPEPTNKDGVDEDDVSESNETQGSDQSEQTRVPKHLRSLFSSSVPASKPKGNPTADQEPLLQNQGVVSELLENYLCGACSAHPFDEDEVGLDDVKVSAEIEGQDHAVKHFLETRAGQFREITLNERATHHSDVKSGTDTLAHQTSPALGSELCAKTTMSISPPQESQKSDDATHLNAHSCSLSNNPNLENSNTVTMSLVNAVTSGECEGVAGQNILVERPSNASSAIQSSSESLKEVSNSELAGVRSNVDSTHIAELAAAVEKVAELVTTVESVEVIRSTNPGEHQSTPLEKVPTATARNPVTLIPIRSLLKVSEERPQPVVAKVLPSPLWEPLDATKDQQETDETVISVVPPLCTPRHINDAILQRHIRSSDKLRAQLSPTSVRATNFWPDATNQSVECCIAFDPSGLDTVGVDKDSIEIACKDESVETYPSSHSGKNRNVEVLVLMPADWSISAHEDFPSPRTVSTSSTLAADCSPPAIPSEDFPSPRTALASSTLAPTDIPQEVLMPADCSKSISDDFDLPPRTSMAAFANFFNFNAISSSPSMDEPTNLACCYTTFQENEATTSKDLMGQSFDLFDDDLPSVDDDGPSLDGGVPSLDGDVPSVDDNGPSLEDGAPSFEGGQSDDGMSLDDEQPFQADWADSMHDSVDRVVEALDSTASGFFPTTAGMGNNWLAKSVLPGFGSSKHGIVDDMLEDVCGKLDDEEITMFISSWWNTKPETNTDYDADLDIDLEMDADFESPHEKRLASVASF
jgi:hypothetical protein